MSGFKPTKYDKIQDDEVAEAIEQSHIQNTDTKLDEGGANEVTAIDAKDAVDKKHTQNTDTDLDATFEDTFVKKVDNVNVLADVTAAGADIDDAVTKRHAQNTDIDLDATFEATFVKKVDNVNVLADITSAGAEIEDAVTHKDLTDNPHSVTALQVGAVGNIVLNLSGNAQNYLFTSNSAYTILSKFIFRGTTELGTPTNIKVIAHVKTVAKPGDVRIYDVTNANDICEVTGINGAASYIVDLGTISNLPSGEAIFEIQAKDPDSDEIRVSGLIVEF